jgi:hypothetical protein
MHTNLGQFELLLLLLFTLYKMASPTQSLGPLLAAMSPDLFGPVVLEIPNMAV